MVTYISHYMVHDISCDKLKTVHYNNAYKSHVVTLEVTKLPTPLANLIAILIIYNEISQHSLWQESCVRLSR